MGVASNSITIYKATDVVRSDTAPSDTSKVWVDTSLDPPALKTYDTDGKVWRAPSELELLAMNEIIESHTTELNVVKGNISTLISDTYIVQEDGTTVSTKELYSQVVQKVDSLSSTVASVKTNVENNTAQIESISTTATQTADKFTWLVKSGTSASDFTLTDRTAVLVSDYINLNGVVTIGGLSTDVKGKLEDAESNSKTALQTASTSKVLALSLTSELCSAPSDPDGNNTDLSNAVTTAHCFFGSADVSQDATYTYTAFNLTVLQNGSTFTVTSITDDTGYIDITASYSFIDYNGNQLTLTSTKRFAVNKLRSGADGQDGKPGENAINYRIDSSAGYILKSGDTTTLTARIYDGNTEVDPEGTYYYTWYWCIDDSGAYAVLGSGKNIIISENDYSTVADIYFTCDSETGIAIVGSAVVGTAVVG